MAIQDVIGIYKLNVGDTCPICSNVIDVEIKEHIESTHDWFLSSDKYAVMQKLMKDLHGIDI